MQAPWPLNPCDTRYNRGKPKALSSQPLLLSITSITYPSLSPIVKKNTREGEKKRKKTQLQNTTIKYIFVSQTSSDWSERDSQWYYSCKRSMPLSRLMCLHLPSTLGPSKGKISLRTPSAPRYPHRTPTPLPQKHQHASGSLEHVRGSLPTQPFW